MSILALSSSAPLSKPNKYNTFQGQERTEDFDLGWYQFKWRNHDPTIGRFFNADPLAESFYYNSTYAFSENKVTAHVELEGLEAWSIHNKDGSSGTVWGPFANQAGAQAHADANPAPGGMIRSSLIQNSRVEGLERGAMTGDPVGIVLHRTVSSSAESTISSFENSNIGTHFVVDTDGTIHQTASLDQFTYHVGKPKDENQTERSTNTIGIEVVGMPVDKDGNATVGPPNGNKVTGWQDLTEAQANGVSTLVNTLYQIYGLDFSNVKTHEELSRKTAGEGGTVRNAVEACINNCTNNEEQ